MLFLLSTLISISQACELKKLDSIGQANHQEIVNNLYIYANLLKSFSKNCIHYQFEPSQDYLKAQINFNWKFTNSKNKKDIDQFYPAVLASFHSLPEVITSIEELYYYYDQPSYNIDLQSLLTGFQKQQFKMNQIEMSRTKIQIGLFLISDKDVTIEYSLFVKQDPIFCSFDCPTKNGKCRDGICQCNFNYMGIECQIAKQETFQGGSFNHYLKPYSWLYIILYQNSLYDPNELIIKSKYSWEAFREKYKDYNFEENDDIYQIDLRQLDYQMNDSFGLSQTSSEMSKQKTFYPNFNNGFNIIENGKSAINQIVYDTNYTNVYLVDDNHQLYALAFGVYNVNNNSIEVETILLGHTSIQEDEDIGWVVQTLLYIFFFILFISSLLLCRKILKGMNCCCCKDVSQENIRNNIDNQQPNQNNNGTRVNNRQSQQIARYNHHRELIAKAILDTFLPQESGLAIRNNYEWDESQPIEECFVCLEQIDDEDNCRITYCFHVLHAKCLDQWLKTNNNCPYCRAQIDLHTLVKNQQQFSESKQNKKIEKLKNYLNRNLKQDNNQSVFKSSYNSISNIIEDLSIEQCFTLTVDKYDSYHTAQEKDIHNLNLQLRRMKRAQEEKQKQQQQQQQNEINILSYEQDEEDSYEIQLEKLDCQITQYTYEEPYEEPYEEQIHQQVIIEEDEEQQQEQEYHEEEDQKNSLLITQQDILDLEKISQNIYEIQSDYFQPQEQYLYQNHDQNNDQKLIHDDEQKSPLKKKQKKNCKKQIQKTESANVLALENQKQKIKKVGSLQNIQHKNEKQLLNVSFKNEIIFEEEQSPQLKMELQQYSSKPQIQEKLISQQSSSSIHQEEKQNNEVENKLNFSQRFNQKFSGSIKSVFKTKLKEKQKKK